MAALDLKTQQLTFRKVLQRHCRLDLYRHDVTASVLGGLRITEPATDLALAMAILSSHRSVSINPTTAFIGELSLTGDLRRVPMLMNRINEAQRLGWKR